jgi:hypothetical protein
LIIDREGVECLGVVLASPAWTYWRKTGCSPSKETKQLICCSECVFESSNFAFVFAFVFILALALAFAFDFDLTS